MSVVTDDAAFHTLLLAAVAVLVAATTAVDELLTDACFGVEVELGEGGTAGTRVRAHQTVVY